MKTNPKMGLETAKQASNMGAKKTEEHMFFNEFETTSKILDASNRLQAVRDDRDTTQAAYNKGLLEFRQAKETARNNYFNELQTIQSKKDELAAHQEQLSQELKRLEKDRIRSELDGATFTESNRMTEIQSELAGIPTRLEAINELEAAVIIPPDTLVHLRELFSRTLTTARQLDNANYKMLDLVAELRAAADEYQAGAAPALRRNALYFQEEAAAVSELAGDDWQLGEIGGDADD